MNTKDYNDILPTELFDAPEEATRWERYNEKNWWDSRRFLSGKYEIVACVGDEYDYTYETVDATNRWKEARRYESMGADVYVNGNRVHFIDHKTINEAFKVMKGIFLTRLDPWWDEDLDPDEIIEIEEAKKTIDQNGFKLDAEWENKVKERARSINDPLMVPRKDRPRYLFTACETEDLPF